MLTRFIDIVLSFLGLLFCVPLALFITAWIRIDSKGPVLFRQQRVGKGGRDFVLLKFRTMHTGAEKKGMLTVGGRDPRITRSGYFLRKYKLDELPQLLNVLRGDMSLVGPRPEVRKYVNLYTAEQRRVLDVKPGITDLASIVYRNENDLLSQSPNPEETYVRLIMPDKIRLNMTYINDPSVYHYFSITFRTLKHIFRN